MMDATGNTRVCILCGKEKPITRFGGAHKKCKMCYQCIPSYRENNRVSSSRWYYNNREHALKRMKIKQRETKQLVIEGLGGTCLCCNEHRLELLTVDHIGPRGIGTKHRRLVGSTRRVYEDILENGCDRSLYRVLCFNCNVSRGFYGYCPHERELVVQA